MTDFQPVRQAVYNTVMKALDAGLIRLSAGNISARFQDDLVAITPSGIQYDVLKPEQVAVVDLQGRPVEAPFKPSSETPMHTAIYRRFPGVQAICHTHSPYAITFAIVGKEVPPVSLELFTCGAPIPTARWACPGTADAGDAMVEVFESRPGLSVSLLRNHGLVAIGNSLDHAFELAYDAEMGMRYYYQALQIGVPAALTEEQMAQIRQAYAAKQ